MKTILLADDEKDIRTIIRMRLERLPYRIIEATTGTEALTRLRAEQPDLVLLDVTLPEMTGIEILETLRNEQALTSTAVILMSGHDEAVDRSRGLALGAAVYLVKPFSPQQLVESVVRLLEQDRPPDHQHGPGE
jgi:CheY-like chemotaxis protein